MSDIDWWTKIEKSHPKSNQGKMKNPAAEQPPQGSRESSSLNDYTS